MVMFNLIAGKKLCITINLSQGGGFHHEIAFLNVGGEIQFQPINAIQFSIAPGYGHYKRKQDQFVTNQEYGDESVPL
jgi:hypothetical protein